MMFRRILPVLLAALLFSAWVPPALAGGALLDYSQTPWGTPRATVLKTLRRMAGPVAQAEHTDELVVSLGSISSRNWRYNLKATYLFEQGRLKRIEILPFSEAGGAIPREKLPELYRDLVGHHRAEYGSPRLVDGKCDAYAACRRTEWLLEPAKGSKAGPSRLVVSEVLETAKPFVGISCFSAEPVDQPAKKTRQNQQTDRRQGLFPGRKIF